MKETRPNPARGDVTFEYKGKPYICRLTLEDIPAIERALGIKWGKLRQDWFADNNWSPRELAAVIAHSLWTPTGKASLKEAEEIVRDIAEQFGDRALQEVAYGVVLRMQRTSDFRAQGGLADFLEEAEERERQQRMTTQKVKPPQPMLIPETS